MTRPPIVSVHVLGVPRPQGSLKVLPNGGVKYGDRVYEWRRLVTATVRHALDGERLGGPLVLHVVFELPRPAGHSGTGRNAGQLRTSAPCWPTTAPDLDKLVRAIGDALTDAGVWADDAQVVEIRARKQYAAPGGAGCTIHVLDAEEAQR